LNLGVSVIICCYNSTSRLPETLKHLAKQQVPAHIGWEVIVVDNASTDNTAAVAREIWTEFNLHSNSFTVTSQPLAGLKNAREKGIATAKYEYLLFCDDDNWLSESYVNTAFNIMQTDGFIGILGGYGVLEAEQPALLYNERLQQVTVCGKQIWAAEQHWVYGAGSIHRKSILLKLQNAGWEQITIGRTGKSLTSGEDVEMCFMTFLLGYKITTDDRLKFQHFIPLSRQSIAYILNLQYWLSYSNILLYSYFHILHNEPEPIERATKNWLATITKTVIKQKILLLMQTVLKRRPLSIDQQTSFRSNLGTFYSLLTNRKKIIAHHYQIKQILSDQSTIKAV
jgi:glycosyltransferase involved in cell wall biosynthesis